MRLIYKENDCSAFPFSYDDGEGSDITHAGMTLRDYFAAAVMPTIAECVLNGLIDAPSESASEGIAMVSYQMSDAMLKERRK
jgi:hypothetical protein